MARNGPAATGGRSCFRRSRGKAAERPKQPESLETAQDVVAHVDLVPALSPARGIHPMVVVVVPTLNQCVRAANAEQRHESRTGGKRMCRSKNLSSG